MALGKELSSYEFLALIVNESETKPPRFIAGILWRGLTDWCALLFLHGSFQKSSLMSYILMNLSSVDQMKRNM